MNTSKRPNYECPLCGGDERINQHAPDCTNRMNTDKATSRPWKAWKTESWISEGDKVIVLCETSEQRDRIVQAVNNHEQLVMMLEEAVRCTEAGYWETMGRKQRQSLRDQIIAALAAAKGEA